MKVRWTRAALRDLESLHDYILDDKPRAATDTVEEILADIEGLRRYPEMGREGRVAGTRELVVSPFLVVYRLRRSAVELVAIMHGARRWPDSY